MGEGSGLGGTGRLVVAGEINPGMDPNSDAADEEHVYLETVWRIPGAPDDVILEPGQSAVIAHRPSTMAPGSCARRRRRRSSTPSTR